jgi:hypothetical protein
MLWTGDGSAVGPLAQEYVVDVNQPLVKANCLEIDEALENATQDPARLRETLRSRGRILYRQLFQPSGGGVLELVRRLRESTEPLLVDSNESVVPWELLHDGEDFLGLVYDLGRRSVVSTQVVDGRTIGPVRRALVVGDTLGDRDKARQEVEEVSRWLRDEQNIACTVLLGAEATLARVIRELADEEEPYDLFHFAGHVSIDPDATGLLAYRKELIDAPALRTLAGRGAPPVVFINGCASAGLTMSVCRSFMLMGARIVVGTRTIVDDAHALCFAKAFYKELQRRVPAGAALRRARLTLAEREADAWAAFVLFGDPGARITTDPRPAPPPKLGAGVEFRFTRDAETLMDRVVTLASARGMATSIELLAGLLETREIRERSTPRIGRQRTALLREALDSLQREDIPAEGTAPATSSKTDGHRRSVTFSDTVSRVMALAYETVTADGRGAIAVDDVAAALLKVGGSTCAEVLELCGISMDQLLAPPGSGVGTAVRNHSTDRAGVRLDGLDAGAMTVVQCARLLAAVKQERVSSYLLLRAFAVTGSAALRHALAQQREDGEKALRQIANLGEPQEREFSRRTLATLESAVSARAQKRKVGSAGESEDVSSGALEETQTQDEAGRVGETELLLALLADPDSSARSALRRLDVDPELVIRALSS